MLSEKTIWKIKSFLTIAFLFLLFSQVNSQLLTSNQVKIGLVFTFTKYFTWEKENQIDTFRIGIYGDDETFISVLKMAEKQKAKNKPVKIHVFNSIADIEYTQILIITNSRNFFVKDIFDIIKANNTLLITDECDYKRYVMANFTYNSNQQVQFEINSRNIESARLKTSPKLVLLGGSEIDVRKLYVETEKSLVTAKEKVENYEKDLALKLLEIASLNEKLKKLSFDISQFQEKILAQRLELSELAQQTKAQKIDLDAKLTTLALQKNEISSRERLLVLKDLELTTKQNQIDAYSKVLSKQKVDIEERQNVINRQEETLISQTDRIKMQQNFLYLLVILIFMTFALVFFIYNNYQINRKKNQELQIVNSELNKRRDEIAIQASQLEIKNLELEKLSIVASKTDNAVIIMNENGIIE